jgi:hypothetical protein
MVTLRLRISVNPRFGEIYCEAFRLLRCLKLIREAANGVRVPLAIAFPGNFSSRTPQLGALVYGCVGDNEAIIIIQISHNCGSD